jgi:DNA invertase Pin-like site-specific DNA recombinase
MPAYGYIRKSVVRDAARMLSPEMQEAAIRGLAARHGDDDVIILSDLDVSGKKDRTRRHGWDELWLAVENGDATAVYAYSLSRFARSVKQLSDFFTMCADRRVPVRMDRDSVDTSTATGMLGLNVLSSLAQFESDVASERVKDSFAAKRANDPTWAGPGNRPFGSQEGEDVGDVLAAFREAGSYDGAARMLNAAKVLTRAARRPPKEGAPLRKMPPAWFGTTVSDIVRREIPDEIAPGTKAGARAGKGSFRLTRVLTCSVCNSVLSPSLDKRHRAVRYSCRLAHVTPHGRGWVSEHRILPAVIVEAEHANFEVRRLQVGSREDEDALAALTAKRDRVIDMAADGVIDKPERDRRLGEVAEAESKLAVRRWVRRITLPPDVEHDDPVKVNAYLRRIFERVVVDMSQPARRGPSRVVLDLEFKWRDLSLRTEIEDEAA